MMHCLIATERLSITRRLTVTAIFSLMTGAANAAPQTLRIDYFHTGNADTEIFSLDQVVLEPLAFAGNIDQPVDRTLRGKYAFEIVDPGTGDIAWSRSYSSIYGEWETIGEARQMNRTFHESVRFPNQEANFELVIRKRNAANQFEEVWRIEIVPTDYLVHRESAAWQNQVIAIEDNGDPAHKVDILMLGDGFTAADQDAFLEKAHALAEELFQPGDCGKHV